MDTQIINSLDALLNVLSNKYLGVFVNSSDLLVETNQIPNSDVSKFLIHVLISDAYVNVKEQSGINSVISISPKGFRFFHSGGYFVNSKTEMYMLTQEIKKAKFEVVSLKYGIITSIASLIMSIIALLFSR